MAYNVYVIELKKSIYKERKKFREANPDYNPIKPCVYVGQTAKTPEERFQIHMSGKGRHARWVHQYGVRLRPKIYSKYNPIKTRDAAIEMEEKLALRLRKKGYGVWFN